MNTANLFRRLAVARKERGARTMMLCRLTPTNEHQIRSKTPHRVTSRRQCDNRLLGSSPRFWSTCQNTWVAYNSVPGGTTGSKLEPVEQLSPWIERKNNGIAAIGDLYAQMRCVRKTFDRIVSERISRPARLIGSVAPLDSMLSDDSRQDKSPRTNLAASRQVV